MSIEALRMDEASHYPGSREQLVDEILGNDARIGHFIRDASMHFSDLPLTDGTSRYGLICGPSHNVFARLLSLETGIPLQYGGATEHLELSVGYYWPDDRTLAGDHTFIKYHTGTGFVGYVDLIYPFLWNNASLGYDRVQEFANYRVYPEEEFDQRLAEEFKLFPFNDSTPSEVWEHAMVRIDTATLEDSDKLNRLMNCADIAELPPYSWRTEATKMLRLWVGYRESPDDVTYVLAGQRTRPSYRAPAVSRIVPPLTAGCVEPTMTNVTAAISRERYIRAVDAGLKLAPDH